MKEIVWALAVAKYIHINKYPINYDKLKKFINQPLSLIII